MSKKNIIIIFIVSCICITCIAVISNKTYAYQYKIKDNYTLFYKTNTEELKSDIIKYIGSIDDYLIPNSNFELSDTLKENYTFLVNFAIDYIINNNEKYQDKIVQKESYEYIDRNLNLKNTKDYIEIEEIYKITEKYFGIRDFQILNNDIKIIDNYISLTDYTDMVFELKILKIDINIKNNQVLATITYENNNEYLYIFDNEKNLLKINNIEVLK